MAQKELTKRRSRSLVMSCTSTENSQIIPSFILPWHCRRREKRALIDRNFLPRGDCAMPNESDSKPRVVNPFSPSKIAKIQSEVRNDHSTEQWQPPSIPEQPIEHPHPISAFQKIALFASTLAAIVSPATTIPVGPLSGPGSSLSLDAQQSSSSIEARPAEYFREVAQAVFEYFLDKSLDEAFKAIAERYAEILRDKPGFSPERAQEFRRFPPTTDPHNGRSIFESAWKLMRPVVCGDQDSRSAPSDEAFGLASTMALKAAGVVSPQLAMWAGLFGACLSIVRKTGVEVWCREAG